MKKRTKSNLQTSLQTLGIVFLIFFAMAFACKDDNGGSETDTTRPTDKQQTNNAGGSCSTEAEFKAIITDEKVNTMVRDYEINRKIFFHSFKVGAPTSYKNVNGRYATLTDNAYPVSTSFDVDIKSKIGMEKTQTIRWKYVNVLYMCYPVEWSQGKTCVCFGEKNAASVNNGDVVSEEDY